MKYLIAGLGNIGEEYNNTRHNIGFSVIDAYIKQFELQEKHERYAYTCTRKFKGRQLFFIKPTTYMNLSGKAINYWLKKENIPIENMLIIVDDISLPFGTIRIKTKGSNAGHNGLKHIEQTLGHSNYQRMRFGIGNDYHKGEQINYVLGKWTDEESKLLPERYEKIIQAIHSIATIGITRTMNFFNGK